MDLTQLNEGESSGSKKDAVSDATEISQYEVDDIEITDEILAKIEEQELLVRRVYEKHIVINYERRANHNRLQNHQNLRQKLQHL